MKYSKPQVIAVNAPSGSYAAGCPTGKTSPGSGSCSACNMCQITK